MRRYEVVTSKVEGSKEVFSANVAHPDADLLARLVKNRAAGAPPSGAKTEELRRRLRSLGAPLTAEPAAEPVASIEATLVEGAKLAHRDATVARAMPLCFWNTRSIIDLERLKEAAKRGREKQAVGFFLALTGQLGGDRRLTHWAKAFKDSRVRAVHDFFDVPTTTSGRRRATEMTPAVARRWKYRMNMGVDSFQSLFDKFAHDRG
jgi:hypothetical protein